MCGRPMTEDEADDHWSEYGDRSPVQVWNDEQDEREEEPAE